MASHLAGRVAIVTGGGQGIGRAIALRLAHDGADVVVVDQNARTAAEVAEEVTAAGSRGMAVFFACVAARPHLAASGGGRIVNIASVAGKVPTPWWAPYGVSKAGVIALTRSLAVAFAPDRIHVNCVCPSPVETAMWHQIDYVEGPQIGFAAVVAFLCSPDSGYMTGQAVNVSGGMIFH